MPTLPPNDAFLGLITLLGLHLATAHLAFLPHGLRFTACFETSWSEVYSLF